MKRLIALSLMLVTLAGCARVMDDYEPKREVYRVAAGNYPAYLLALQIVRDVPNLSLAMLTQPQDGCLRAYQLSEWDALQAVNYDALVLIGRGMESYESTLMSWEDGPIVISASEGLTLLNNGAASKDDEEGNDHFQTENPWLFLSPDGAGEMLSVLAASLSQIDPLYADQYGANLADAKARLEKLGVSMYACMAGVKDEPVAVLHEGLFYFADYMGLTVACSYVRESGADVAGTSLEELLASLSESGARAVLLERQAPDSLTDALEAAGFAVAKLDTFSAHAADGNIGAYEEIMLANAQAYANTCNEEETGK